MRLLLTNSSTSREGGFRKQELSKRFLAAAFILCLVPLARATDTDRAILHYSRQRWGNDNGFPGGPVSAIAQTSDGYLWIGTEKGLLRFDGSNFQLFKQATPSSDPIGPVEGLTADAEGNLWILLKNTQILHFKDGKFELGREETEFGITSLGRRADGSVLFSSLAFGTLAYRAGKFQNLTSSSEMAPSETTATAEADTRSTRLSWAIGFRPQRFAEPNSAVTAMAETRDGKIWLGTRDKGLFYLSQGRVFPAARGLGKTPVNCLLAWGDGELWIGTEEGVMRWNGREVTSAGVPSALRHAPVLSMIQDRNANIWVGTSGSLIRVNGQEVLIDQGSPETNGKVTALYEDREGNIWMGGPWGIERLHKSVFVSYSEADGLPSESNGPIFVDQEGRTWFAPLEGGLDWIKGGETGTVTDAGLDRDVVYTISGREDELWIGRERGGLTLLRRSGNSLTAKTYTQAEGLAQNSVFAVYQSRDGTLWAGTLSRGVSAFRNGRFTNYTTANGLSSNTVTSIAQRPDGSMSFATPNGLSLLSHGKWQVFTADDGLPSSDLNCVLADSAGVLWVGTTAGIAFLISNHVQTPRQEPEPLREPILGIAEDKNGWLWISTSDHVLRVKRSRLLGAASSGADVRVYGPSDGLLGTEGVKRQQTVFADPGGRIWFSLNRGLSVVDPDRAGGSSVPALIDIDTVYVDGTAIDPQSPVRISSARQRITFGYTGLSFSNPERIRYRYRLDGFDRDWSEPSITRTAEYTSLGPGSYRFRVIASNGDGLWNSAEATLPLTVDPMWWQTLWVRLLVLLVVGSVIFAIYRSRLNRLARQYNIRLEERLAERTRIAQDLHDTLLQGALGASMQLHVALDVLPEDSPERPKLNRILELIAQVVEEGRGAVRGMRSSIDSDHDLKNSFLRIPNELGSHTRINFQVNVRGESLTLRPAIYEEVYRIGREALMNAFRHSRASEIEMVLEYQVHQFRLLVRDDGCGIESDILLSGREGHWGLSGMRSRAKKIGASLGVSSRPGDGTEVELCVPSQIAFVSRHAHGLSNWINGLFRRPKTVSAEHPSRGSR
jgi:signal transduction histidine kinase/ligand-binding sensor domain-containing protein